MMRKVMKLGFTLMAVGLVAAVLLGLTYAVTKDRIAEQKRIQEAEACVSAMPAVESAEELREDPELEKKVREKVTDVEKVFRCPSGVIIILKVKGYGGPMRMAVGIGQDGKVAGVSVISHNETPGLGSNVENPDFLEQFVGMGHDDPVQVGEDIQAITGATITSKAAAKDVREALEAYENIGGS
jgi:Na+-translocating ferredoxin:NAD+ oxidoreductase subunit G